MQVSLSAPVGCTSCWAFLVEISTSSEFAAIAQNGGMRYRATLRWPGSQFRWKCHPLLYVVLTKTFTRKRDHKEQSKVFQTGSQTLLLHVIGSGSKTSNQHVFYELIRPERQRSMNWEISQVLRRHTHHVVHWTSLSFREKNQETKQNLDASCKHFAKRDISPL